MRAYDFIEVTDSLDRATPGRDRVAPERTFIANHLAV